MTDTDTRTVMPVRALDTLLGECWPVVRGRKALIYWRPCAADTLVRVPRWKWESKALARTAPADLVGLDVNGSYFAPLSGVELPLSGLERPADGLPGPGTKVPGYYLIDYHTWSDRRIVSPLGTAAPLGKRIWVPLPVLELLRKLELDGRWPDLRIYDAWTAAVTRGGEQVVEKCRLDKWATHMKALRTECLVCGDRPRYEAVKSGWGAAYSMMLSTEKGEDRKSPLRRPDWYRHLVAAQAVNTWRKVWNGIQLGAEPLAMHSVDEVTYTREAYELLQNLAATLSKRDAPMQFDQTGIQLGAMKVKGADQ